MCFGSSQTATDPSQDLLDRESIQQNNVKLGKSNIDKAFGQFDDNYFKNYKQTYQDNYVPQLDTQYKTAVGKMIAGLAGRGIDRSSVGASAQGHLAKDYLDNKTAIASEADTAANTLRSGVETSKSNLYALNNASADPEAANTSALGQAKSLVAPPAYSPLGDVFAAAVQPYQAFGQAQNNTSSVPSYRSPYATTGSTGGRNGSARVIK